jgi:hypothetical protein
VCHGLIGNQPLPVVLSYAALQRVASITCVQKPLFAHMNAFLEHL